MIGSKVMVISQEFLKFQLYMSSGLSLSARAQCYKEATEFLLHLCSFMNFFILYTYNIPKSSSQLLLLADSLEQVVIFILYSTVRVCINLLVKKNEKKKNHSNRRTRNKKKLFSRITKVLIYCVLY